VVKKEIRLKIKENVSAPSGKTSLRGGEWNEGVGLAVNCNLSPTLFTQGLNQRPSSQKTKFLFSSLQVVSCRKE